MRLRLVLILLTCGLAACERQAERAPEPASNPPALDRAEILDTVDAFFLALGSADADALEQLYAPHTMVVIVTPEAEVSPVRSGPARPKLNRAPLRLHGSLIRNRVLTAFSVGEPHLRCPDGG